MVTGSLSKSKHMEQQSFSWSSSIAISLDNTFEYNSDREKGVVVSLHNIPVRGVVY